MRSARRLVTFVLVVLVLGLVAGACGDGENDQVAGDTNRDEVADARGNDGGVTTTSVPFDERTGDAGEPGGNGEECSGADISPSLPEQPLPVLVERTRNSIATAAAACNFTTLGHLASQGDQPFTFSFGGGTDPVAEWKEQEASGEEVVRRLLELLRLPHVETGDVFVWPSAYAAEPTDADWDALRAVYPDAIVDEWRDIGTYLGHRVGIAPDGEWLFYVAGD